MDAIPFTSQNMATLNKMIVSGYYEGHINDKMFRLKRANFPVNYLILGTQENESSFELKSELKEPIKSLMKPLQLLGLTSLLLSIIYMNIVLMIVFLAFAILIYMSDFFVRKKEIKMFLECFHLQQLPS